MTVGVFRFSFSDAVPLDEVEMTLQLAIFAVEGLHGMARVRLEFGHHLDAPRRAILVDGTQEAGAAIVHVFIGLLLREFGEDAFRVERMEAPRDQPHADVA